MLLNLDGMKGVENMSLRGRGVERGIEVGKISVNPVVSFAVLNVIDSFSETGAAVGVHILQAMSAALYEVSHSFWGSSYFT